MIDPVLAGEWQRVNRDVSRIMAQGSLAGEVPTRIHTRETDAGGAPELSHAFTKWIGQICSCGRPAQCAVGCRAERFDEHLAACEPACLPETQRFYKSRHRSDPARLKKCLRMVRRIDPKAHDLLYCLLVLHMGWHETMNKLNSDNLSRGKPERSEAEFLVLGLSAGSMLSVAY